MKPLKTFLFLACTLAVVLTVYFYFYLPETEQSLADPPQKTVVSQASGLNSSTIRHLKEKEEKEAQRLNSLTIQWSKDSMMLLYKKLYRLEPDIFEDESLHGVPLCAFEYDTAGAGRYLLQDFFARLLALRHSRYAGEIAAWYEKPDFWNEDLIPKRRQFVRVLHYGGSLIENDYVSATLRELLQDDFGGTGVGLLPLFQNNANFITLKKSGKWYVFQPQKTLSRGNFGVYMACLAPPPVNALGQKTKDKGNISITLPEMYRKQRLFLETILHEDVQAKQLQTTADRKILQPVQVVEVSGQQRICHALPFGTQTVDLNLTLSKNAYLYALSLNDTIGVYVDNLAVKNNDGSVFSHNNRRFLINQLGLLNTGLVLYQFDGSAALGKNKDYNYYRMLLMKELGYIRMLMPQTPVIVIGTASSGNIDLILDIQRECAFACGCVFWNLEQALGGENALARWAEAQPALVSRNLSHFTPRGAEWVGKMFYRAFLYDYRRFLLQEKKNMMMQRARQLLPSTQNL